jgi:hypothetical protein
MLEIKKELRIKDYMVGTDIEVFLFNTVKKEVITAEGIIKGSKYEPEKMDREGCATQLDNVSLEYNVPPTSDPEEMWDNINYVINTVTGTLPEGIEILVVPSATLKDEYLQSDIAKTMGCDVSYNAWTRDMNARPDLAVNPNLRCCGGHIHIGYNEPDVEISEQLIRAMDLFIGLPSILMDKDTERKKLYGKAGEFRFTDYGCEYRVVSNFWSTSKENVKFIYDQVKKVIDFINSGNVIDSQSLLGTKIVEAINTQNVKLATEVMTTMDVLAKETIEKYVTA